MYNMYFTEHIYAFSFIENNAYLSKLAPWTFQSSRLSEFNHMVWAWFTVNPFNTVFLYILILWCRGNT